jgi:hypothetical protein
MSRINSRAAALAIVILSLGFAATGAAPALAHVGPTQISPRATAHRHVAYQLVRRGYAGRGPASRPVEWTTSPNLQFVQARGTHGASCALPSSGCPDDERITN